eukprot:TRINITY_DN14388_c0_g1_i1.p1 TRINITY_DN14388_c0_g1~~TRINITY_DN14388_c0_g1_i1.p1  ORF type:complete len:332 (+),score=90.72 TRINITY_DN14388_c0_g1_i1:52-1047(+)
MTSFNEFKELPKNLLRYQQANQFLKLDDELKIFIEKNSVVDTSPNFLNQEKDDIISISELLRSCPDEITITLLTTIKILFRKEFNRQNIPPFVPSLLVAFLNSLNPEEVLESLTTITNLCYSSENVNPFLKTNIMKILKDLISANVKPSIQPFIVKVQSSACQTLQSLSFTNEGKLSALANELIPCLIKIINKSFDESLLVQSCLGALHNISIHPSSLTILKDFSFLNRLIELLESNNDCILSPIVGIFQNLATEEGFRDKLMDLNVLPDLMLLLQKSHSVDTLSSTIGAILNIIGPEFGKDSNSVQNRKAFADMLSSVISLNLIVDSLDK